ncbi:unnamed protein product [Amoebophrya sp. A25]|nr:unnamed protein product [Amoebophrya sp. A25]|eukprot:GSA25T00009950001.1
MTLSSEPKVGASGPAFAPSKAVTRYLCVCGLYSFSDAALRALFESLDDFVQQHPRGHAAILEFATASAAVRAQTHLQRVRQSELKNKENGASSPSSSTSGSTTSSEHEQGPCISRRITNCTDQNEAASSSPPSEGSTSVVVTRRSSAAPSATKLESGPENNESPDHDKATKEARQEDRVAFSKVSFCALVKNPKKEKSLRNTDGTRPSGAYTWATLPVELRPQGLTLEEEFITEEEEQELVEFLHGRDWDTTLRRRVQHFGMRFDYLSLKPVQSEHDIPDILSLSGRFSFDQQYNQVTVNEYHAGIGIAPHVETHSCFEEGFCSVSLLGGIVMDFRRMVPQKAAYQKKKNLAGATHDSVGFEDAASEVITRTASTASSAGDNLRDIDSPNDSAEDESEISSSSKQEGIAVDSSVPSLHTTNGRPQEQIRGTTSTLEKNTTFSAQRVMSRKKSEETGPPKMVEQVVSLYLPRRSRITFHGEARLGWRHGIASRVSDVVDGRFIAEREYRISLTYRKVKERPHCDCAYFSLCDFQNPASMQLPKRKLAASNAAGEAITGTTTTTKPEVPVQS